MKSFDFMIHSRVNMRTFFLSLSLLSSSWDFYCGIRSGRYANLTINQNAKLRMFHRDSREFGQPWSLRLIFFLLAPAYFHMARNIHIYPYFSGTRVECRATRYNPLFYRLADLPTFRLTSRGLPVPSFRSPDPPPPLFLIAPARGSVKTR